MDLFLEQVRVFNSPQWTRIAPLTLLVGENSTGKSTFLAMLHAVNSGELNSLKPEFNSPPFDLGSFDTIATYRGGQAGRANSFTVGLRRQHGSSGRPAEIKATYGSLHGQPELRKITVSDDKYRLTLTIRKEEAELGVARVGSRGRKGTKLATTSIPLRKLPSFEGNVADIVTWAFFERYRKGKGSSARRKLDSLEHILHLLNLILSHGPTTIPLSPVRTKPRRTYDEVRDEFQPTGDHIPVLLARLYREGNVQAEHVFNFISDFGRNSNLLEQLRVKSLGKRPTDPFQIMVKGHVGPAANLVDVGYGVSQALPIIVESLNAPKNSMLLMQQPEVHLHPRAQAAIGSALVGLVESAKLQFVVETHSDYILDRVRQHVAATDIAAEDVRVLYFSKKGLDATIHELTLDDNGNLVGAPPDYRSFFMEEEMRLFDRNIP